MLKFVPKLLCGGDDVLIRVVYAGVCGSDIHMWHDNYKCFPPIIIGHEFSGVISEIGNNATGLAAGDRVVSMTCPYTAVSANTASTGFSCSVPTSVVSAAALTAIYLRMPAHLVMKITAGVEMGQAALSEPLASVCRVVLHNADVKTSDYVYISGLGLIGQLTAQFCTLAGANVTVAGTVAVAARLAMVQRLCGTETVIVEEQSPVEVIERITGGHGFEHAFGCAGAASPVAACVAVCKRTGSYHQVGLFGKVPVMDMDAALFNSRSFTRK